MSGKTKDVLKKVLDKFAGTIFTKEGETVEEAKARMINEQERLQVDAERRVGEQKEGR